MPLHDARGRARSQFHGAGVRVRLEADQTLKGLDLVFVNGSVAHAGQKDFPNALSHAPHGVKASIPVVELADHADALCGGRPYCEARAPNAIDLPHVGAQPPVNLQVGALGG